MAHSRYQVEGTGASENLSMDLGDFRGAGLILRPSTDPGALTELKDATNVRVFLGMRVSAHVHSDSLWSIYYTEDIFMYRR